jgi:hypothetical protein
MKMNIAHERTRGEPMSIKRKDPLSDKKVKAKQAGEAVRKVSKRVNFDEMPEAFTEEGLLVPLRGEVFFERKKESRPIVCVGMVHTVYPDGSVDIWDETHQEFWGFNYRRHLGVVKVRSPLVSDVPIVGIGAPKTVEPTPVEQADTDEPTGAEVEEAETEDEVTQFKLWLDDERDPPDDTWVIARSTIEAMEMVTMVGAPPHVMSLDHDLGITPDGKEDKVIHFLTWLEETSGPDEEPPEYTVHSQNPVGRENTIAFMEAWKKSRVT